MEGFIMKKYYLLLSTVIVFLFFSCSTQELNIGLKPCEESLSYSLVRSMPYMGGYMLYNSKSPSYGQLQDNSCFAIRFGKVSEKKKIENEVIYSDIENAARYGFVQIKKITEYGIDFIVVIYDSDGTEQILKNFNLYLDSEIDINGDGFPDLKYIRNPYKRENLDDTYLLEMKSSQEDMYTTMFSVYTGQYLDVSYPIGLIGINPEGKYIYSLYRACSPSRSLILGARYGDYVFDSYENKYKKIISRKSFNRARALSEDEVEESVSIEEVDMFFSEDQFENYGMVPNDLLAILDSETVQNDSIITCINILNNLLKQELLIHNICGKHSIILPEEILSLDIDSLSEYEIVSLNRLFLSEYFKDYCPPIDFNNNDVAEIFPLFSVYLPKYEIENGEFNYERAANRYDDYVSQKKSIENEFNSYTTFGFLPNKKYEKNPKLKAEIGIYGKYSVSWSNTEASLGMLCFVQIETELNFGKSKSGSLLGEPIEFVDVVKDIHIGIIPFSIGLSGSIDIPYKCSANLSIDSLLFAGYTGLYGGECFVGVDYGVKRTKWFKVWRTWIYKPKIYVEPYSSATAVNRNAYYIGFQNNLDSVRISASAYLNPKVEITPKLGVCHNALWFGLSSVANLRFGADFYGDLGSVAGTAYIDYYLQLIGKSGLDLKVPVINKKVDKDFSVFTLVPIKDRVLEYKLEL